MIEFVADQQELILRYSPQMSGGGWIWKELKTYGEATISRVFTLKRTDLLEEPSKEQDIEEFEYHFRFATKEGAYYRFAGRIFGIGNDVMLADTGIKLERKLFVAERNVSIFRRLAEVVGTDQDIVVGGSRSGNIPIDVFEQLRQKFPNSTELDRYANARVANIIGEYFEGMKDFRVLYETYLSRRKSVVSKDSLDTGELLQAEIDKFVLIRDTINQWLGSSDSRTEKEWQRKILEFILLIFPKYIAVLENVKIEDHYSTPGSTRDRYIDIALVDANGNLDVIEIKRPFDDVLLSKTRYRDNFVPTKDLSGTIMQAEKYLFHLSKWGVAGEEKLTKKYAGRLPSGMSIRITNPKALLILGRDRKSDGSAAIDQNQLFDLELIKRKYANMMDIITYDDLLRRLDNIIASLHQRAALSSQPTRT
jgi:Domain of unknown function (DUF4263)